jgi:hypothetical protein
MSTQAPCCATFPDGHGGNRLVHLQSETKTTPDGASISPRYAESKSMRSSQSCQNVPGGDVVVYTARREDTVRIISARWAIERERALYLEYMEKRS